MLFLFYLLNVRSKEQNNQPIRSVFTPVVSFVIGSSTISPSINGSDKFPETRSQLSLSKAWDALLVDIILINALCKTLFVGPLLSLFFCLLGNQNQVIFQLSLWRVGTLQNYQPSPWKTLTSEESISNGWSNNVVFIFQTCRPPTNTRGQSCLSNTTHSSYEFETF